MPIFVGILAAIVIVAGLFGYLMGHGAQKQSYENTTSQAQPTTLLAEIDKVYKLPTTEHPTVVTIKDEDKLKDQQFFKDAKNGDQLVMYSNAKLALIYRQAEHKLVNVGPINYHDSTK